MKRRVLSIFFLSMGFMLFSQQKTWEKANALFENQEYFSAIPLYISLYNKEQDINKRITACERIAFSYEQMLDYDNAANWYEKLYELTRKEDHLKEWGKMLYNSGQYQRALEVFQQLYDQTTAKSLVQPYINSCRYALQEMKKTPIYEVIPVNELNSPQNDYTPYVVQKYMIFSSSRIGKDTSRIYTYDGQGFSDIYVAEFDSSLNKWINIRAFKGDVNRKFNEGVATFSKQDSLLLFMRCNEPAGKGKLCKIFSSRVSLPNANSGKSVVVEVMNKEVSVGHPTINSRGDILFFVSDDPAGIGGKDIYVVRKDASGKWSNPKNLGSTINTSGNEMFPVLYNDTILYFSSDGHLGFGGLDIYRVKVQDDQVVGSVVHLDYPVNTAYDDFSYNPINDDYAYFSSNRKGGKGGDDIYLARPLPFTLTAKGKVVDKLSQQPIPGALIVVKLNNEVTDTTYTDKDGIYRLQGILSNKSYEIFASKEGYIPQQKTLQTFGEKRTRELSKLTGHDIDFELFKITKEEIVINNIYYDFDKWNLREESKKELDKIVAILNENPKMKIQINSHTDVRGSEDYNLRLSEKRAKSVVDYLISKGIDPDRLMYKGWGKTRLLIPNAQTEEEHQLNRRTTFNLLNPEDLTGDYEKLYSEIDRGLSKNRVSYWFRLSLGNMNDPEIQKKIEEVKSTYSSQPLLLIEEDGKKMAYVGAFVFLDDAIAFMENVKSLGLTDVQLATFKGEQKIGLVKLN